MGKKLLVVSVAGLDAGAASALALPGNARFAALHPPFPAVTCTAQATFRTGAPPSRHGMAANGFFDRRLRKVLFWEQAASLVEGPRFWEPFRGAGGSVGLLFWQQAMGEAADLILTPAPIHKHHGGMVMDCYSRPAGLYRGLTRTLGAFPLHRYWGPLASAKVGDWIAGATVAVMAGGPDLLLTYLPTLDYDFQRFGPDDPRSKKAVAVLADQLRRLLAAAGENGYDWLVWGDYAIEPCSGEAIFPNRRLREAGLMEVRDVRGRLYADLNVSRAFAVADHATAQLHAKTAADAAAAREVLAGLPGVAAIAPAVHERAGDWVLTAEPGRWFAYPWWTADREAPDYARHVDIHNKPGYDPCELIGQWWPPGVTLDTRRIGGTHGRNDRPAAWACSWGLAAEPATLEQLSAAAAGFLAGKQGA